MTINDYLECTSNLPERAMKAVERIMLDDKALKCSCDAVITSRQEIDDGKCSLCCRDDEREEHCLAPLSRCDY